MTLPQKQQVVFIGRALWGGGAEKVTYDLAHALDRSRFEPHVVHLFDLAETPITYDPAIAVHPVEPILRELLAQALPAPAAASNQSSGVIRFARRVYYLLSPSLRNQLGLGRILRGGYRRLKSLARSVRARAPDPMPFAPEPSSALAAALVQRELARVIHPVADAWPQALALNRVLAQFQPDAILISIMEEAAVRVWLSQVFARRPYIASLHIVESLYMPLIYPEAERCADEEWLLGNACRSAEVVTVPSQGCRDDLSANYNVAKGHIRVMANPVNCALVRRRSQEAVVQDFPRHGTVFVQVARLDYQKNQDLLIAAAECLRAKYDDFTVLCLGKGNRRDSLQTQIQARGLQEHVYLLGEVANPYPYMAAARALVLTSRLESFGLVLLEAMLCGAVPIAVDCPFGPRDVLDDGRYGMLVPPNDPEALAEAMWRIAHDDALYRQLRALGPGRAEQYDIAKVAREWEDLLDEVRTRQRPPAPSRAATPAP